jgi:hypothetical protein
MAPYSAPFCLFLEFKGLSLSVLIFAECLRSKAVLSGIEINAGLLSAFFNAGDALCLF